MTIRTHLELSTGHLTGETRHWLATLDWPNEGPSGGCVTYGWFLYAHDDNDCHPSAPHAPEGEYPADLWAAFEKAREMGVSHLYFDRDADECPGLAIVDEDEANRAQLALQAARPVPDTVAALRLAESFMSGFEGDELQDGIGDKLATIRAALSRAEGSL